MTRPLKHDYKKVKKDYFALISREARIGKRITQKNACEELNVPLRTLQFILKGG